jgi:NAD(P)H-dependent FMN reductase
MEKTPIKLAVIVGSTREGRFGHVVAGWFAGHARSHDAFDVDYIVLVDVQLPPALPDDYTPELRTYAERLDRADAFVIVTPEYNHGYPASLKQAIDLGYAEWNAKPVGFVSYGGASGGIRAVEQLRQVFAELHAVTVRDAVSFHGASREFDESGNPVMPERPARAAHRMLDRLAWWGRALRTARAEAPYAA